MSINPDNSRRELNSSPNYYQRAISFPPTILSNILLFAHIRVTHMAFEVSRLGIKKPPSHIIILLLLINEERGKKKSKPKVMSHLNALKPDVELRNRH